MNEAVVIIGAGQAGVAAASKLRTEGFDGKINLIGRDPFEPYQRPPLSKAYMLGRLPADRMVLKPPTYFEKNQIDLLTGVSVTDIDSAAKLVQAGDTQLSYSDLVLTPGADPIVFPSNLGGALDGVHYLRTRADADGIAAALGTARNVLVVGGGYIGLEIAAAAKTPERTVTVAEASSRILSRVACVETSDFFRDLHTERGVIIREGTMVERLEGDGGVEKAVLSDGSALPVDLVVIGIGVRPSTGLAMQCGLVIDNGIAVDSYSRTSMPNIWSAGDCCSFPHDNNRIRLESVPNAIAQGENVALNILGKNVPYTANPWFWSDQFDLKLQIAGLSTGYDNVVIRAGASNESRSHWYYRGADLIAVDAMNDPRSFVMAKKLIAAGISPEPSVAADTRFDLKTLV